MSLYLLVLVSADLVTQTVGLAAIHALRSVHGLGILHGNIRASNILVCFDSRVLLVDFGFSRSTTRASDLDLEMKQLLDLIGWKQNPRRQELFTCRQPVKYQQYMV
jgi:serine/threonine protein kinase